MCYGSVQHIVVLELVLLTLTGRGHMPRIRYIRGNCAGRMPHVRYMQNARRFTALFCNIPAFRQVLRVPQPISFYSSTFN